MFKLEVKTGGAAFRDESRTDRYGDYVLDPYATEVRRILRDVICELEAGRTDGAVMDVNGNKVGRWSYK